MSLLRDKSARRSKRRNYRAGEMDFKVEGPWNAGNYCRPPWLAEKKNF